MANTRRYRPGFLKRSVSFAVPAGLIVTAGILAVNTYATLVGGFDVTDVQSASVITLSLIALWVLVVVSRPLNLARIGIVIAMYAVLVGLFLIPLPRDFFGLAIPPSGLLQVSIIASAGGCLAVEILGRIRSRKAATGTASERNPAGRGEMRGLS